MGVTPEEHLILEFGGAGQKSYHSHVKKSVSRCFVSGHLKSRSVLTRVSATSDARDTRRRVGFIV
jgi:hypothetical protein